jgi:sugar phosphate permease
MSLNGFFQATIRPGIMGIFGNWFKKSNNSGTLLAVWAISGNLGNIYASNICNFLEIDSVHWTFNFAATGVIGIVVSVLMFLYL